MSLSYFQINSPKKPIMSDNHVRKQSNVKSSMDSYTLNSEFQEQRLFAENVIDDFRSFMPDKHGKLINVNKIMKNVQFNYDSKVNPSGYASKPLLFNRREKIIITSFFNVRDDSGILNQTVDFSKDEMPSVSDHKNKSQSKQASDISSPLKKYELET